MGKFSARITTFTSLCIIATAADLANTERVLVGLDLRERAA